MTATDETTGMKISAPLLICGLLWAGPSARPATAGSRQEFAVWPSTDDQETPDIFGTIIVWQQFVNEYGDYDIYIADLNEPVDPLVLIVGDANDQMSPAVFESTVVWQDYIRWQDSEDWDIWMADLSNPAEPNFYPVSDIVDDDEQKPAISGNIVVWQSGEEGAFQIWGADITEPDWVTRFPIANFEGSQRDPGLDRTTVVWQDDSYGDWDVFASDIWRRNRPRDFSVAAIEKSGQQKPAVWGDTVVWEDDYYGDWDIYIADISDTSRPVERPVTPIAGDQANPDIDAGVVVWQDNRNSHWDIYGYNITTRREFRITDDPYDQINPAISGNIVTWQDNRGGSWNVYAVVLDPTEVARCGSNLEGDADGNCRIDFADFAIMASQWLECRLKPADSCPY
ncbi:MAG: hypothetical protein JSU94_12300 [Phycisphaerales bacterium]|nr:MAG: hypothetical protein JSU94_12300 [Phycisphaerales bacterium]